MKRCGGGIRLTYASHIFTSSPHHLLTSSPTHHLRFVPQRLKHLLPAALLLEHTQQNLHGPAGLAKRRGQIILAQVPLGKIMVVLVGGPVSLPLPVGDAFLERLFGLEELVEE